MVDKTFSGVDGPRVQASAGQELEADRHLARLCDRERRRRSLAENAPSFVIKTDRDDMTLGFAAT